MATGRARQVRQIEPGLWICSCEPRRPRQRATNEPPMGCFASSPRYCAWLRWSESLIEVASFSRTPYRYGRRRSWRLPGASTPDLAPSSRCLGFQVVVHLLSGMQQQPRMFRQSLARDRRHHAVPLAYRPVPPTAKAACSQPRSQRWIFPLLQRRFLFHTHPQTSEESLGYTGACFGKDLGIVHGRNCDTDVCTRVLRLASP